MNHKVCVKSWSVENYSELGDVLASTPLFSVNPLTLTLLSLCLSACWPWEEGEQMLDEGGRGDVGVHADHHVLSLNSLLLSLGHHNSMAALPAHCSPAPPTKWSGADHPDRPHHVFSLCCVFPLSLSLTVFTCPAVQPSMDPPPVIPAINLIVNLSVLKYQGPKCEELGMSFAQV